MLKPLFSKSKSLHHVSAATIEGVVFNQANNGNTMTVLLGNSLPLENILIVYENLPD